MLLLNMVDSSRYNARINLRINQDRKRGHTIYFSAWQGRIICNTAYLVIPDQVVHVSDAALYNTSEIPAATLLCSDTSTIPESDKLYWVVPRFALPALSFKILIPAPINALFRPRFNQPHQPIGYMFCKGANAIPLTLIIEKNTLVSIEITCQRRIDKQGR